MSDTSMNRAYRNGWILVIIAASAVISMAAFVFETNDPGSESEWRMGGVPFVPASSNRAEGWYVPGNEPGEGNEK